MDMGRINFCLRVQAALDGKGPVRLTLGRRDAVLEELCYQHPLSETKAELALRLVENAYAQAGYVTKAEINRIRFEVITSEL